MNRLRHWGAGALLSLFLVPAFGTPVPAQVVVGSSVKPQIEVDTSVLDRLGSAPTLPDLFLGTPAPTLNAPGGDRLSGARQPPGLRRPHAIVLKKPAHKAAKPKTTVAAKSHPKQMAATSVPAIATPSPAPKPNITPKPDNQPTEAPKPTSEQSLPPVSLPVIVPQNAKPAEAKPEVKPEAVKPEAKPTETKQEAKPETKPETKGAGVAAVGKAESQPAPPIPPKLAATPTPPIPDKAPATASAAPNQTAAPPPVAAAQVMPTPVTPPTATPAQPPAPATEPAPQAPAIAAPAPSPSPAAREQQEARLPPAAAPPSAAAPTAGGGIEAPLAILFEKEGARLPDEVRTSLSQLADRLASDPALQIQLLAYAEGDEDNASKARRLSLSRALAVRSYLIDQGVRSTRIEVRALGNKVPEGPADRVDILVQKR